jgi:membrane-bound inhibitor of C-type lysozyme
MTKNILSIIMLSALTLTSCNQTPKGNKDVKTSESESLKKNTDDIVTSVITNKTGEKLELIFNNTKETATIMYNGETIELTGQKPASGIWYKNEMYELRGKGNEIELTKNGKTIFKSYEENISQNPNNTTWWIGKHFIENRPASPNPEEGGINFLIINKDNTAEYKIGDIVHTINWVVEKSTLICSGKTLSKKVVFNINTNFLTDEFGTKWIIKK